MQIGIETTTNLIYEGQSYWGHASWPSPNLIPSVLTSSISEDLTPHGNHDVKTFPFVFREDAFDPVSRVRRGRFYKKESQQPRQWQVHPHPAMPKEIRETNRHGVISKSLATFISFSFRTEIKEFEPDQPLVLMGLSDAFTVWTVTSVEKTATGEDVVSLKSRQSFGVLPKLLLHNIPELRRAKVQETIQMLTEEIYRAGPESVIDRTRDAAAAILGTYVEHKKIAKYELDLGPLIKKLATEPKVEKKQIVTSASEIIRIFHARVKPSEQEKRRTRQIVEQDAELAVQCVGAILCDLGWAKWQY